MNNSLNYAHQVIQHAASIEREYGTAKEQVATARETLRQAKRDIEKYVKAKRDAARQNERRASIVGDVALALGANDTEFWAMIWPQILARLVDATDEDRTLFELPPRAKPHQEHGDIKDDTSVAKEENTARPTISSADMAADSRSNSSDSSEEKRDL